MIRTESLSYSYHPDIPLVFPDISLEENDNLLIIGESGIGKTTLLHLLSGLLIAKSGKIILDQTEITQLNAHRMDKFRGDNIGLVYQQSHFINSLTLNQNMLLVQYLGKKKADTIRINTVLDQLRLVSKANDYPKYLSQGEQQRASIAMAVLNEPRMILADEPTSSLDDRNCRRVIELIYEQSEINKSHLIVITHDSRLKSNFKNILEL